MLTWELNIKGRMRPEAVYTANCVPTRFCQAFDHFTRLYSVWAVLSLSLEYEADVGLMHRMSNDCVFVD